MRPRRAALIGWTLLAVLAVINGVLGNLAANVLQERLGESWRWAIVPFVLIGVLLVGFEVRERLQSRDENDIASTRFVYGDEVGGDAVGGDKVMRDKVVMLPPSPALGTHERRDRPRLLANVRASWIKGVLEESLWSKARLDLPLVERPGAVRRPYSMHERGPDGDRPLPAGTPIRRVYDGAGQSLLILGAPGAGKTTLLLELALALLDEAETALADPTGAEMPVAPVVFNLASWARGQLPLDGWLAS